MRCIYQTLSGFNIFFYLNSEQSIGRVGNCIMVTVLKSGSVYMYLYRHVIYLIQTNKLGIPPKALQVFYFE